MSCCCARSTMTSCRGALAVMRIGPSASGTSTVTVTVVCGASAVLIADCITARVAAAEVTATVRVGVLPTLIRKRPVVPPPGFAAVIAAATAASAAPVFAKSRAEAENAGRVDAAVTFAVLGVTVPMWRDGACSITVFT
jgi:hypothetical protein